MHCFRRLPSALLFAGCLALTTAAHTAEEPTTAPLPEGDVVPEAATVESTTIGRSANVESKLSAEFSEFLGGEDRAGRVVEGLRTGGPFELEPETTTPDESVAPPPEGATTGDTGVPVIADGPVVDHSIDPPTEGMGYGNVRITLKLAQARLEQLGITNPTDEQLAAVLVGGDIGDGTVVDGILTDRAAGAGWGELAQKYDFKVGELMGKAPTKGAIAPEAIPEASQTGDVPAGTETPVETAGTASTEIATAGKARGGGNGYIPSGGSQHKTGLAHGATNIGRGNGARKNGYVPSGGSQHKSGLAHGATNIGRGNAARKNGYIPSGGTQGGGAGIVSAHGSGTASSAKTGNAHGHAKGGMKGFVPSGTGPGAGIVSAGNASTTAAVSAAGGHGQAKGHAKAPGKAK